MSFGKIVRSAPRQLVATSRSPRRKTRRGQKKLRVEALELRLMLSGSPIWVSNTDDSGDGSLRDAIEEANANPGEDTIKFRSSAWDTIALSSQLLITDDLVIDGPGAQKLSVSGQGAQRVFLVLPAELADDPFVTPTPAQLDSAPEVTIRELTVKDGLATDAPGNPSPGPFAFGGGIYNVGGTVRLEKVEMTGNRAENLLAAGGAVANEFGGTLTVSRSHFAENTAGGVLVGVGGAITSDLGPTVEAKLFSIEGSGLAPDGFPLPPGDIRPHFIDAGKITIGDTTLNYTGAGSVQTFDPALGLFGSADPFIFTDADGDQLVTYYGRTDKGAQEEGTFVLLPADQHPDDPPFEEGDVFAYWIAEFVVQPESTGKYAGVTGSWIMDAYSAPFAESDLEPTGANFPLPYRWESRGDASLVFPGVTEQPEVRIDRSSFEYNAASAVLGHIPSQAFSGLAGGGAILNVTGLMSIDRSTFTANSVQAGYGIGGAVKGGPGFGGAINSSNISPFGAAQSVLEVRNSNFVDNVAIGGNGGETGPEGGEAGGGAIKITNGGEAHLDGNVFEGSVAIGGNGIEGADGGAATGGAVAGSAGAALTLSRNSFSGNSVDGGASDGGAGGVGRGGALGLFSVDLTGWIPGLSGSAGVSHGDFADNTATGGLGGGIYNEGELTVSHSSFTGNEAIGSADVVVEISAAGKAAGGAVGGGIANLGTLTVTAALFERNLAQGADDVDATATAWPDVSFPGGAWAGALANMAVATVDRTRFVGNVAEAGDRGQGSFATLSVGGAVYNDASLTLLRSDLRQNESRAGDDGISPFHNGHALGGALASGTLLPALGVPVTAELVVSQTRFRENHALGGSGNEVTLPLEQVPPADGPNNAYGGAILVYQGSVELDQVQIIENEAIAGAGGAAQNGSLGVGGGVFLFDFLGGVSGDLNRVMVRDNRAVGGAGTADSEDGGAGIGGGIAVGSLGSPFAAPGSATISHSHFHGNVAQGGAGFGGGSGGAGQGGGLANVFNGATTVRKSVFKHNQALGGQGGINGNGGDGQGGGIYNASGASLDLAHDLVFRNLAAGGDAGPGGSLDGAGFGGGIFNEGDLDIALIAVFGNEADFGDDFWL